MMPVAMCNLLMRSCSAATENVYACLIDQVPTNPKHRVDQLTKIKTKLKDVVEETSEDCRKTGAPKLVVRNTASMARWKLEDLS